MTDGLEAWLVIGVAAWLALAVYAPVEWYRNRRTKR
jgi:hypothetical protein